MLCPPRPSSVHVSYLAVPDFAAIQQVLPHCNVPLTPLEIHLNEASFTSMFRTDQGRCLFSVQKGAHAQCRSL